MTDKRGFVAMLSTLAETFRIELNPLAIDGYWLALQPLGELELRRAAARALASCKFMPTPVELLGFAGKAPEQLEAVAIADAWEAVRDALGRHGYYGSVDFGPLVNAVIRNMGGWMRLSDMTREDAPWKRKEFEKLYIAFAARPPSELRGEFLPGKFTPGQVGGEVHRIAIGGRAPMAQIEGPRKNENLTEGFKIVAELANAKRLGS